MPIVIGIAGLHMILFTGLMSIGLQFVPASRAIVLGYTTPLWVIPGAVLFLGEPLTRWRVLGVSLGIVGLAVMFNPLAFAWGDQRALLGNAFIMLAALCWAISILQVRGHRWVSTPFQLVLWEVMLATVVLAGLAYLIEGVPNVTWTLPLLLGSRVCQRARHGARLLGDGHGQPQPARHDDLARPARHAGGGNRQRGFHAGRADHAVAHLRHGADHRRHRRRHACRRNVALARKL